MRKPPTLLFVVPAHGRTSLARVCLRQLRRTCDGMAELGIEASAIVVSCDENLETARELGFGTVRRNNAFLSRRFNDGIQLALDPKFNPRPADFVVPCGSDDWVDPAIFGRLPGPREVVCFRHAAFVDETGRTIVSREIDYDGGVGIRIYPRALLARTGYRPADEDRKRGCDTTILVNVRRSLNGLPLRISYADVHPYQIVDWKSPSEQLNAFGDIVGRFRRGTRPSEPSSALAGIFPDEALEEIAAHYAEAWA